MWLFGKKCFICKKHKPTKKADICKECMSALHVLHPDKGGHHGGLLYGVRA